MNWKETRSLPEQVVFVSVATTKEQPGLSKRGLGRLLPLLLPESHTADVSSQSIVTDEQMEESESFLTAEVKLLWMSVVRANWAPQEWPGGHERGHFTCMLLNCTQTEWIPSLQLEMKLGFSVCVCVSLIHTFVSDCCDFSSENCPQKEFLILALEFGKPAKRPCCQHSESVRTWLSVPHTCCKRDSSPPDNNVWPPTFHDAIRQLKVHPPPPPALSVTYVLERGWLTWPAKKKGWARSAARRIKTPLPLNSWCQTRRANDFCFILQLLQNTNCSQHIGMKYKFQTGCYWNKL